MSAKHFVFIDNTSNVKLKSLRSAADDSYLDNAIVTMTLKDSAGSDVTGQVWPITLDYVATSNGDYTGTFAHGVALVEHDEYIAEILAILPDGSQAKWNEPVEALIRDKESQLQKWWPK